MKQTIGKWNRCFIKAGKVCVISSAKGLALLLLVLSHYSIAIAGDAVLSWDPNTESDLAGYKVYFGTAHATYGSPVDVGNQTTYTVIGLNSGTFYFAVTAYDTSGNESDPSNETTKTVSGDSTPPAISAITSTGITGISATITWTTNEASDTQVQYGTTSSYGSSTTRNTTMLTFHSQGLTGLSASTTYHFKVVSSDASGNLATSGDNTFTTAAPPDTTAPVISGITSSSITVTGAIITWATNETATSRVEYGTTTAYGLLSTLNSTPVTSHSRTLTGLSSATTYHYRVISTDTAGNTRLSSDNTFATTTTLDTTPPVISNIATTGIASSSAVITWTTNEAATSEVDYGTGVPYDFTSSSLSPLVTNHSRSLTGLGSLTTYHFKIRSRDAAGNIVASTDQTFMTLVSSDTTGPVISNIAAGNMTGDSVVITWTTNESATTAVEYGPTTGYGNTTSVNATLLTDHTQTLSGLSIDGLYHYRVRSIDASGNLAVSEDRFFTAQTAPDSAPPADVKQFTANPSNNKKIIQLSWINPSDSDFAGVVIRYRTDGTYPVTETEGLPVGDFKGLPDEKVVTDHTGLQNKVTYYYAAFTYDIHGNYSRTAKVFATLDGVEGEITPSTGGEAGAGGGGCSMMAPNGRPSSPGQAADMIFLIGVLIIALLKNLTRIVGVWVCNQLKVFRNV